MEVRVKVSTFTHNQISTVDSSLWCLQVHLNCGTSSAPFSPCASYLVKIPFWRTAPLSVNIWWGYVCDTRAVHMQCVYVRVCVKAVFVWRVNALTLWIRLDQNQRICRAVHQICIWWSATLQPHHPSLCFTLLDTLTPQHTHNHIETQRHGHPLNALTHTRTEMTPGKWALGDALLLNVCVSSSWHIWAL